MRRKTIMRIDNFEFPNERLVDHHQLVEKWWSELDTLAQRQINRNAFARFMLEKRLIRKEQEAERIVREVIHEQIQEGMVKESQFQKLFSKAILRGAIENIHCYVQRV